MYSIGRLGFVYFEEQAHYMQGLLYIGLVTMIGGIILGFVGLKKDESTK